MRLPAMTATQAFVKTRVAWYGANRRPGQDVSRIEASGKIFLNDFAFDLIECLPLSNDNVTAAGAKDFVEYAVEVCGYDDLPCWSQFHFPVNNITQEDVEACIDLYNLEHS